VKLLDPSAVAVAGGGSRQASRVTGYVTEADGQVHVALLGKLYSVPLGQLVEEEETFRFVQRQDQFVLRPGEPAKLAYSAPGAAKYHLQLWYQRPHFPDDEPALRAESSDGTFTLAMDEMERYVGMALPSVQSGPHGKTADGEADPAKEYLAKIEPFYRSLTGKAPKGVLVSFCVSVVAEHEDGQQKAGLAHSYLVEVPMEQVLEKMGR
jgi:hypothetical protein